MELRCPSTEGLGSRHPRLNVDVAVDVARIGDAGAVGAPMRGIHRDGKRSVVHNGVHDVLGSRVPHFPPSILPTPFGAGKYGGV